MHIIAFQNRNVSLSFSIDGNWTMYCMFEIDVNIYLYPTKKVYQLVNHDLKQELDQARNMNKP